MMLSYAETVVNIKGSDLPLPEMYRQVSVSLDGLFPV